MQPEVIDRMKSWDWQTIVNIGASLDDLNDAQWRFLKGLVQELALEKFSGGDLKYVGKPHKDFEWLEQNLSVEAKAQSSQKLFDRLGKIKKKIEVKLNNSNGTNVRDLDPNNVCDIIVVTRRDGGFAVDKSRALACARKDGDGFVLELSPDDIICLSGRLEITKQYDIKLKEQTIDAARTALSSL
jgi:hypothetical protein